MRQAKDDPGKDVGFDSRKSREVFFEMGGRKIRDTMRWIAGVLEIHDKGPRAKIC